MNTNPPRTVHLIDVENLVGTGRPRAEDLAVVHEMYRTLDLIGADDHVIVSCNPFVAIDVGDEWAPARLRIGHGPSGADEQLVQVAAHERIEVRFERVVIASGDGIFTDVAVWLQQNGVPVTVVSRRDGLSLRLRMAATDVIYLDVPPAAPAASAGKAA
jgi:hypothetical protein